MTDFRDFDFEEFFAAYLKTALWSSLDNDAIEGRVQREGENLDDNFGVEDIADETRELMRSHAERFVLENLDDLIAARDADGEPIPESGRYYQSDEGHSGHNFWLNTHGHGAGFWDGDYPEEIGERLDKACDDFRPVIELWGGEDGKVYHE